MPRGSHNSSKTHCPHGHPFTATNTRWSVTQAGTLARQCRACHRERSRTRRYPATERCRKWRLKNRTYYALTRKARDAVKYAVRVGKIQRPEICSDCKQPPSTGWIEAHHHCGYQRQHWLDVVWLCSLCHSKAEARIKQWPELAALGQGPA